MESGSWIASIFGLGAIFGGFAAGYLGTKFGQRKTMFMLAVPDIVAWIFIASAQNIPMMLFGRFLAGFSAAAYSPTIQVGTFLLLYSSNLSSYLKPIPSIFLQ